MTTSGVDTMISDVARRYLQLQQTTDVGPIRLRNLISRFGSVEAVLSASISQLQCVEQISPHVAEAILRSRADDAVEREVEQAAARGLQIVCAEDNDYPQTLLNIPDPPICLYIRGKLQPADCVAVAIVGTRRCSHYGREQAIRFGEMLGGAGFTIVSGLARGIDGHAHRGALQGRGRTIAVLGNGLGTVYPPEHESLAEQIVENGALISELAVDTPPDAKNFPPRNRIITGLSLGVMVIEAGKSSGALITARLASEYNREVFAVPGRVDRPDLTAGVHGLIREGQAKLVTCLEDVLDELGQVGDIMRSDMNESSQQDEGSSAGSTAGALPKLTPDETAVWDAVTKDSEDPDTIRSATGLEIGIVMATLTSLQIKGLVQRLPGDRFVRRSGGPSR